MASDEKYVLFLEKEKIVSISKKCWIIFIFFQKKMNKVLAEIRFIFSGKSTKYFSTEEKKKKNGEMTR